MPRSRRANPSKPVVLGFAGAIIVGALLLMLPFATNGGGGAPFRVAIFTATSAVCVTGLTVVDTATYWSPFGQTLIMVLIQIGGLGIMTGASLLFMAVSGKLGLRQRMMARQERGGINLGSVRSLVLGVVAFSLIAEAIFAGILSIGFWSEGAGFGEGLWRGAFFSVSAFNNAGFSLFSDSLIGYASDPVILLPIALALIIGGLGFPVWLELLRRGRTPQRWSLHTKLTLVTSGVLLAVGWAFVTFFEWGADDSFGHLSVPGKILSGFFSSAAWRTAGFSSIDYSDVNQETLLGSEMLMFVGGGTGSTAGGIKVTTFVLLVLMAIAEVRGREDVTAFRRRIPGMAQRQVLTIAFAAVNLVVLGALALMYVSDFGLSESLFEAVSAVGTVGLSTGITPEFSGAGDAILIGLMYIGRVGPLTLAVALVLREHAQRFRYPEERPLVG